MQFFKKHMSMRSTCLVLTLAGVALLRLDGVDAPAIAQTYNLNNVVLSNADCVPQQNGNSCTDCVIGTYNAVPPIAINGGAPCGQVVFATTCGTAGANFGTSKMCKTGTSECQTTGSYQVLNGGCAGCTDTPCGCIGAAPLGAPAGQGAGCNCDPTLAIVCNGGNWTNFRSCGGP